mmetsp:Transcript_26148/g.64964  ORF Transcript_26148/g.64964 Transcript_26148/m.64964 type:complete len:91 (-) Transcript_26148:1410-1682(-)
MCAFQTNSEDPTIRAAVSVSMLCFIQQRRRIEDRRGHHFQLSSPLKRLDGIHGIPADLIAYRKACRQTLTADHEGVFIDRESCAGPSAPG